MNVNPVNFAGANQVEKAPMSKGKKVAIAAGAIAGTAAIASAVAAVAMGKSADVTNLKGLKKVATILKEGYQKMGAKIAKFAKDAWGKISESFENLKNKGTKAAKEAAKEVPQQ